MCQHKAQNWEVGGSAESGCEGKAIISGPVQDAIDSAEEACPARLHHWYFSWKSLARDLISSTLTSTHFKPKPPLKMQQSAAKKYDEIRIFG